MVLVHNELVFGPKEASLTEVSNYKVSQACSFIYNWLQTFKAEETVWPWKSIGWDMGGVLMEV